MKHELIWKTLSDVREDYIEEASPDRRVTTAALSKKRIRNRLIGWGSLAASIVLIAALAFPWIRTSFSAYGTTADDAYAHYPTRPADDYYERYPCVAIIPTFPYEEDGVKYQLDYPPIEWNGKEYYRIYERDGNISVSADLVGEVLGEVEAEAHEMHTGKAIPIQATLHTIEGIDEEIAIAFTVNGYDQYTVYRRSEYTGAASLTELVETINLQEHLTVSENIFHTTKNVNGEEVRLVFEGMTAEILWNELLSHGEAVDYSGSDGDYLRVKVSHAILKSESVLCITSDGYITFSMLSPGKAVYVGKERVREFLNYLEDNLNGYRLVEEAEQYAPAEQENFQTVTMTSATPPYNPNQPE